MKTIEIRFNINIPRDCLQGNKGKAQIISTYHLKLLHQSNCTQVTSAVFHESFILILNLPTLKKKTRQRVTGYELSKA